MAANSRQAVSGATQDVEYAGFWARFTALLVDSAIFIIIGVAIGIASAPAKSVAATPPPAPVAKADKPAAATPPPAQATKMDSEPRAPARRRRASRPKALPAPAPALASAPAAEPKIITPKYNDVMTAVMVGDEDAVNQLLDLGWWVDKPSSIGLTPLMAAVMNRNAGMVQVLLARGADPNAQAPGGVTALRLARDRNDAVTAKLLEQRGAR